MEVILRRYYGLDGQGGTNVECTCKDCNQDDDDDDTGITLYIIGMMASS